MISQNLAVPKKCVIVYSLKLTFNWGGLHTKGSHYSSSTVFLPTSTYYIFNAVLVSVCRSPVCEEIINCRGDHVRLGVRVKVYPYPENAIATWIMFACKYKSVL